MAINYVNLPGARLPDTRLDFSPINDAIDGNRNWQAKQHDMMLADAQNARAQSAEGRAAKNFANSQTEFQQGQEDRIRKSLGQRAMAAYQEKDPARKAAMWNYFVAKHPGRDKLDPQFLDPNTGPQLALAEAGLLPDTNKHEYGKTGAIFQGEDGKFYSVQFNSNGQSRVEPITTPGGAPMEPAKGVKWIDDGITQRPTSVATGAPVQGAQPIQNQIAEVERQKVIGRESGEGAMGLQKAKNKLDLYEAKTAGVDRAIDQALTTINTGVGTTGLAGQVFSNIGGTDANNLRNSLNTIRSNMGFDELQSMRDNSPTGGALGQVAVQELEMLQATFASIEQSQKYEQLVANLQYLKMQRAQFQEMRRRAYQADVERFGAARVPDPASGQVQRGDGTVTPKNMDGPLGSVPSFRSGPLIIQRKP